MLFSRQCHSAWLALTAVNKYDGSALANRRNFEQADKHLEPAWLDPEIVIRQASIPFFDSTPQQVRLGFQVVDSWFCAERNRGVNVLPAVFAKEKTIVENDINSSSQERGCTLPNQFP